ncbi:MAG: TIM barrel protein [Lactobacillaceae bacterium]|nr:TIM barrel protein [Lactobacillaceae bacterium]
MRKYGVKLWSSNIIKSPDLVKDIAKAVNGGVFDFVELFAVPDTFDETAKNLFNLLHKAKVNIHASHSGFGFDTGNKEKLNQNLKQFNEAQRFADLFNSPIIVTHTGMGNLPENIEETIRQFKTFNDKRIAVENLPSYCSDTYLPLHGITPEEIKYIKNEAGCMFCFDFSHAICAAHALKMDKFEALKGYADINPSVYHISDGDFNSDFDAHDHFGEGNYPIKEIVEKYSANDALLTIETGRDMPTGVEPWVKDMNYLKNI